MWPVLGISPAASTNLLSSVPDWSLIWAHEIGVDDNEERAIVIGNHERDGVCLPSLAAGHCLATN